MPARTAELELPWQAHARGLAGHLVLGLTTEGLMQAADLAA